MGQQRTNGGWQSPGLWRLVDNASLHLSTGDPLQSRRAWVPRTLEETRGLGPARLSWDISDPRASPDLADCLWSFIKLADGSDRDILRFARRWGPLGVCAHGTPYTHLPECTPLNHLDRWWESPEERLAWGFGNEQPSDDPREWKRFWEPLSAWRFYSRKFAALLAIGMNLGRSEPVEASVWYDATPWESGCEYEPLVRGEPYPPYPWHEAWTIDNLRPRMDGRPQEDLQELLANWVSAIVRDARVTPYMDWPSGEQRPQLTLSFGQAPRWNLFAQDLSFDFDSVFAVLAAQLVAALQHPNGLYECSICHSPMTKERKQRRGQRRYCSKRCRDEGIRESKRAWATKNRQPKNGQTG